MNSVQFHPLQEWYNNYTGSFTSEDSYTEANIRLKIKHTDNVRRNILNICNSISLSREKKFVAEVIALFHDIGRFEQLREFRTFNDARSVNHAELGIEILQREKVLINLNQSEREIIINAIRHHNLREIPQNSEVAVVLFSKLIRDADKLDILDILTQYYHSAANGTNPALDLDLSEKKGFSAAVLDDIMNNQCVDVSHASTTIDFKLMQMSWVFDIYFPFTYKIIIQNKYIEKLIAILPPIEGLEKVFEHILDFLKKTVLPSN